MVLGQVDLGPSPPVVLLDEVVTSPLHLPYTRGYVCPLLTGWQQVEWEVAGQAHPIRIQGSLRRLGEELGACDRVRQRMPESQKILEAVDWGE